MDIRELSRRRFFFEASSRLGAAWLTLHWPAIVAAASHAHQAAKSSMPPKLEFFSPAQAAEVEAIAAQIIPTDDTPGAREAGVIHFIDRALTTFDKDNQKLYASGLAEVQAKLHELFPGTALFSAATGEQQIAVLKAIEKTPFFGLVRSQTIIGFLADPGWGGNRGKVGWELIGFEDQHVWEPPFGYYDRDYPGWQAAGKEDAK